MALAAAEVSIDEVSETIRQTPVPLALLDLVSTHLILLNTSFADLLGLDAAQFTSLELLSLVAADNRDVLARVLAGLASGQIDSCEGRGLLHSPQGRAVDVVGSIRSLGSARPRERALLVLAPAEGAPLGEPWLTAPDASQVVFGAIDHDWRIREISADATKLLGWDPYRSRGTPLQALVHPDDISSLLLVLGRSGAERRAASSRLRVRGVEGDWTPVRLVVSPLCDHNPSRFSVALWCLASSGDSESSDDRAARLEGHLWRITAEVQAAGIGDLSLSGQGWWMDPALRGLSRRQSEILRRLTRGERVPAIASELFVSQSTVRNHLAAIYRRVGVHSQSELLARLMPGKDPQVQ